MKKFTTLMLALVMAFLLVACGDEEEKSVVLASKPMTEQFIIAEMLIAVIEQETELTVEHKASIGGGTSNIHPAMMNGEIDLYPEYTGTGWMDVLNQPLISEPDQLYSAVKESYESDLNIYWSELYGFNDTFGIAMKRELAEELGIETYSDLAAKSSDLVFGAEHDFYGRDDGYPGIEVEYGFDFKDTIGMDIGLKYQAIESGEVDVINIFSTDGKLEEYDMVVLEDDKLFFPSYYAATLVRQEVLDTYPELKEAIALLDSMISNEEMTYMNYLVEVEKKEAKEVAIDFLNEKGILK
jgi:glycine betaine/choline ABC-type transport system substrate-binding protein